MLWFLKFYDICGFNTQHSTRSAHRKKIIFYIHLFIVYFLYGLKFYILIIFKSILTPLEIVNEMLHYLTALSTYCIIVVESYAHHETQHHFWKLYEKIDKKFFNQNPIQWQGYTFKFIISFIIHFLILITFIKHGRFEPIVFIAFFYLTRVCHLRYFYYLLCLKLIEFQLKAIENEAATICWKNQKFQHRNEKFSRYEMKRLKWIRELYENVYEMVDCMNESFGWSHLFVVIFCSNIVMTDMNWAYLHLSQAPPFLKYSNVKSSYV